MGDHSVATFHATQGIEDKNYGCSFMLGRRCSFGEEIDPDLGMGRFQDERNGFVAISALAGGQKCRKLPLGNAGVARVDARREGGARMLLEDFWESQDFCAPARKELFRSSGADAVHIMPSDFVCRQAKGGKRSTWNQQNICGKKAHASSSSSSSFR